MTIPTRQIRAVYDDKTIRVYQAYSDAIADSALEHGTFESPPFKMERMTWIKPSFLWMMYRAGWGKKDAGQKRILAIDITRKGFEWALENSLLSHDANKYKNKDEWLKIKKATPVRIQWDPERDLHLQPLEYRAIQIGLTNEAVPLYVNEWIQQITDVTDLATEIHGLVEQGELAAAEERLPVEEEFTISSKTIRDHLNIND
ncbi:DUF4291 domain-containing protein [Gynuella sunshinyii]|uniref:DUF4291 domain-containing protein n=1 Tax=Gynuella sunshinyii YC6258 TaxID=1445510 RepID=A0A0C5VDV0_9GAMM|nr:DUF4291 domain-containing protein [Gynuella sunshinyii]AJQ92692.1 hypothetical Protein YC6258_00642 [Gynuella sunshinyii YC6258]